MLSFPKLNTDSILLYLFNFYRKHIGAARLCSAIGSFKLAECFPTGFMGWNVACYYKADSRYRQARPNKSLQVSVLFPMVYNDLI